MAVKEHISTRVPDAPVKPVAQSFSGPCEALMSNEPIAATVCSPLPTYSDLRYPGLCCNVIVEAAGLYRYNSNYLP